MRYKTRFWYGMLGLLMGMGQLAKAQDLTLQRLQDQLASYRDQTLQEKLFVHTDRSFYLVGEQLWFRIFYVDGTLHRPLTVSKVAYLELLDKEQKPVLQTKVSLEPGKASGNLALPASLASGTYILRAYTQWMKTVSPAFFFEKPLTIVNPFRLPELPATTDSLAYDVQFFPEGGELVSELPATVAFKVVNGQTGRGVDCRGVILNQTNDTLVRFASLKFGMGSFPLLPRQNQTYRVLITDASGRTMAAKLPPIREQGYTVQVSEAAGDQLLVRVHASEPLTATSPRVYLIGHTRQVIKIAEQQPLQTGQAVFMIAKNRLGDGISHLTVFDAAGQPVCERLYFKRPEKQLTLQLKTDAGQYSTRAPVTLDLQTTAPTGVPLSTDVSVSVYRVDSLQGDEGVQLPGYLWLTSELRGTIESPAYYLTSNGPEVEQATDQLMLTQGWRRFRWAAVLANTLPTGEPEARHLVIRARVTQRETGKSAQGVIIYLSVPGKNVQLQSVRSDEQGLVRFDMPALYGATNVVLQVASGDSAYRVEAINPYADAPLQTKPPVFDLNSRTKNDLITRSLAMQVQNSYFSQYGVPASNILPDSSSFYGVPDERYLLDAFTRFTVLEEVLSEYVPGVLVRRHNRHFVLRVNNMPYQMPFDQDPLMLLDGVPVFDTDRLMAFSPLKIKSLDVVSRRYFLGYSLLPGIISFRTYKNDLAGFQLDPQSVVLEYDGLQARREFYAPQYRDPQQIQSRLPDFRNLLYWNPQLITDAQGQAQVTFYTSDQEGAYRVVMQGLTTDGRFGQQQHTIVVRPLVK